MRRATAACGTQRIPSGLRQHCRAASLPTACPPHRCTSDASIVRCTALALGHCCFPRSPSDTPGACRACFRTDGIRVLGGAGCHIVQYTDGSARLGSARTALPCAADRLGSAPPHLRRDLHRDWAVAHVRTAHAALRCTALHCTAQGGESGKDLCDADIGGDDADGNAFKPHA